MVIAFEGKMRGGARPDAADLVRAGQRSVLEWAASFPCYGNGNRLSDDIELCAHCAARKELGK